MKNLAYNVKSIRATGLEAKWTRTRNGAPIITARNPESPLFHQRTQWYVIDGKMWNRAQTVGLIEAFNSGTLFGDIFSVPA